MINNFDNIPAELKAHNQWVMWKREEVGGKLTKIPYQVNGNMAKSTDPITWNSFEACIDALDSGKFSGIGFVITEDLGMIFIDWDKCRDHTTGQWKTGILEEIMSTQSYSEISQSETGGHSICYGGKPGSKCKRNDREMYVKERFVVMTGKHIPGTPTTINEAPVEAIQAIYDKIAGTNVLEHDTVKKASPKSPQLTDSEVISLCMGAKNANKFEALWDGDTSAYGGDDSAADQALCDLLAFYTQDPTQIDRLFRGSGLYRDKWERGDYRDKTIESAIKGLIEVYQCVRNANTISTQEEDIETLSFDELKQLKEEQLDIRLNMDLPDDHFLTIIRKWQESRTDAYPEYHFMGGLWLLSALCQGKVVLKLKSGHVEPNIWVTILGLTTISHKTTSINNTKYIFETVTETRAYNNSYSLEGYLEHLQDNPVSHFIYDEVAGLLAKMHAKYNDGIFDLDCSLYSGSSVQKTLASKRGQPHTVTVDDPYVTKLYATTPEKFTTNMQQVDFECGWGFRFLYCWPKYKKSRMGLATETQEDIDARGAVITRALKIYQLIGQYKELPFTVEPAALKYLDETVEHHENIAWNTDNDAYAAATGRGQENCLKIAMLLELGKSKPSFCISLDTMKYATDLVFNYFVPATLDVYDRILEDVRNNHIEKIVSLLRKKGGVGYHSDLLKESRILGRVFNECIDTMIESGTIKVYKEKETGKKSYVLHRKERENEILSIPKIPTIHTFSHTEQSVEKNENLISDNTIYTPTMFSGFVRELEKNENCENCENFEPTTSEGSGGEVKKDDTFTPQIEECLDQWEKFGDVIFAGNAHKAKLDIVKFHKMHGVNPDLIYQAVDKRAARRCIDCGSLEAPNRSHTLTGEVQHRCNGCYQEYQKLAPITLPETEVFI